MHDSLTKELKRMLYWIKPEICFVCNKCVSGCPVAEVRSEYRPNKIVKLAYLGFIDELIQSGIIWYCTQCLKCSERCPMDVHPASVIVALRNIASKKKLPPEAWIKMAKNICVYGRITPEMGVVSKDRKLIKREDLGLRTPVVSKELIRRLYDETLFPMNLGD
ncbi:MAG: 4Fe-4S dicluster domain-containing protein [Crenarchaeota archaeon]|nr:4Fe-4S dicluster domain-containing protein [Thermoproteota archaeon]